MRHLSIDLETYSDVDIKKAGAHAYVRSPEFQILLNAYQFWGEMQEPVVMDYSQENVLPKWFVDALLDPNIIKHAYNATFEYICFCRALNMELPKECWRDTMLHSLYCGYPASLDAAGKAVGLSEDKQKLATDTSATPARLQKPTAAEPGIIHSMTLRSGKCSRHTTSRTLLLKWKSSGGYLISQYLTWYRSSGCQI